MLEGKQFSFKLVPTLGQVICWSIYCGDQVDFGSGPRLFIDNLDEDGKGLRGLNLGNETKRKTKVFVSVFSS